MFVFGRTCVYLVDSQTRLYCSGLSALNTKPELEKELERRKLEKQKKEVAEQIKKNRNSFEQKLDQQKEKLYVVSLYWYWCLRRK